MGKPDVIHVEGKRNWWTGKSTTLCSLVIPKFKAVSRLLNTVNCAVCAQRDQQ
ncbi:hypothetical protein [Umezawaea tangerina]|uniref:Uncharacterized protein n=1 Tax=Umezawaea tangerina TaxID=84725 RepID=A0A2T0TCC0_9PSEU|nr:hypothetical protein [Umezawaea tangerina]PRY43301.1 hypothetical protein CLV43_10341 [Umezawaea tangerina]